jgi:Ca2+-binding RTX toxin-like protein
LRKTRYLKMKNRKIGAVAYALAATQLSLIVVALLIGLALARPADAAVDSVSIEQPSVVQGDVNCDDGIDPVDALLILRFSARLGVDQNEGCPEIETEFALTEVFGDVDCAGVVNPVDALKILRHGAGLSVNQNEPPPCTDVGQVLAGSETVDARIAGQVLKVKGTNRDDEVTLRLKAGDANVLEIDVGDDGTADFSFDRADFGEIDIQARDGDDVIRVDQANGNVDEPMSIRGEKGDDTLLGGSAIDAIDGGPGDDFVDGNQANDIALLGDGDDTFRWDPGDASDVVEGEDGDDTLLFNGANGGETVDLLASGERFVFLRQPGNITMDVDDVETSVFNALGGPDVITVNDLSGTDVTQVALNLDAGLGGGTGDGLQDQVIVIGTAEADDIVAAGGAGNVNITGLQAAVAITAAEAANDLLAISAGGGDDAVDASGLQADAINHLIVDGEAGGDLILGSRGVDILIGGAPVGGSDGNDLIDGNQANDIAFMGAGDDTFRWDPGDGSDTVEGEAGDDTLLFNGANVAETVDLSANGERFTFFRQPGNITMDVNDVETSVFNALGDDDVITVNDLTGTDVTQVDLNLENPLGSGMGDGRDDQVIVNGTAGDDSIVVAGSAGNVNVTGLSAEVAIAHAEAANDRLDINTLAGNDTVDRSGLPAGVIQFFVDGVLA